MRKSILAPLALCLLPVFASADVTYEEETKMGGVMSIMTLGKGMKSTTRVSGNFMRTDQDNNATIIDLEGEKVLTLDTKKKTYSVVTFEEMKKQMEEALAAAKAKAAEPAEKAESTKEAEAPPSDVSASADVRVTETGRTETIQGLECKQYLMELDLTFTSEKEQQSGTMSTVTEMWLAREVPGSEEINAFHRRMLEKMGTTTFAAQLMSGGKGQDQTFTANMQKMGDEMKKMEGHAMRSVMYFGSPEAAKQEAMGEKKSGGGSGFGGLGGMLKKMKPIGNEEPSEGSPEGEESSQGGVIMKMTTETKKIDTKPIDPKVFAVPGDYKLVEAK